MKIAIVVHGRFHAFDLARELVRLGHDVYLLTNYPKRIAARFGIPAARIRNNLLHGVVSRAAHEVRNLLDRRILEPAMHRWFSRWAAKVVQRECFDVIHGFTGVCEELFRSTSDGSIIHTLLRGSAHVEEQSEILSAEEQRTGKTLDKPSRWMRQRELREYLLADRIIVLSQYAYDSFVRHGTDPTRLRILLLGAQLSLFRPNAETITERGKRIRDGKRLRVLTVGTFSYRKGAFDLVEIARQTCHFASFRFVGAMVPQARALAKRSRELIQFIPKVPQFDLPVHYNWGDVFLFPTLEDGYAVVLAQAAAAGLPILSTTNCVALDLIKHGETGWVFPIRRSDLFIEQLQWCDQHREELAAMVERTYNLFAPRDWSDVAQDFVSICAEARGEISYQQNDVARA
jgi:glycosyltransferase involved in cell wall biosynthesis